MSPSYPDQLPIVPFTAAPTATVSVPGSKSITNRAFVLAALASREMPCSLTGVLRSEDTEVMVDCLRQLGYEINVDWTACVARVRNATRSRVPAVSADLFVANSGTTMRFVTALASLGRGRYRLDGVPRMRERPIEDLLSALRELGVETLSETGNGCPPVLIEANGIRGGSVEIRANISSQFLSGLMMAAPFADFDVEIRIANELVSEPYVEMTANMLAAWGVDVRRPESGLFVIPQTSTAGRPDYQIEPDASAASYFWAIPAVLGTGAIRVRGLTRRSMQGDVAFADVLWRMGCRVDETEEGITVHGGSLRGVDVDMNAISDTVMTLAAVALFAEGPTTIRNVAHIRHKETDRIAAVATELRKLGTDVEEFTDGLRITPRPLTGSTVDTYNDHRMAMSLALIGLKVPGMVIDNPGCVAKTYPGFWQDLERLRS